MYGLTKKEFYDIINILKKYKEDIKWVKIFGSRANGKYKKASDIDLGISFRRDIILKLYNELYNSNLPYTVDIIDYDKNSNNNLKNFIDNEGEIIFQTENTGELKVNENKLIYKIRDLEKAIKKLQDSLQKDPNEDDLYLDGTIQRFEFVYELSWKLLKNYLDYTGIRVNSPRESIREGFKIEVVNDINKWLEMLEDRNRTSHTYNEDIAWEIYRKIKSKYIFLFEEFYDIINERIKLAKNC